MWIAIVVFLAFLALDLPRLVRQRQWKEMSVFLILSAIALTFMIRYVLDLDVFSFIKALSIFTEENLGLNYALWQGHS